MSGSDARGSKDEASEMEIIFGEMVFFNANRSPRLQIL
jgi:hypothetical protein